MSVYPILFFSVLLWYLFSDAGLQLQSSNLLLGLMKLLSPAPHYLALPRGGWSSKGYVICKARRDRAGRRMVLLISYLFFSSASRWFYNVAYCFFFLWVIAFYFYYHFNSLLFLSLYNMMSLCPKELAIQIVHGLREEAKGQSGVVNWSRFKRETDWASCVPVLGSL